MRFGLEAAPATEHTRILVLNVNNKTVGVVFDAVDGREATRKYKELSPDVVTMGIVMPEVSGIEALKLGAVDYVVKPFEKDRVTEAMQRVVAG